MTQEKCFMIMTQEKCNQIIEQYWDGAITGIDVAQWFVLNDLSQYQRRPLTEFVIRLALRVLVRYNLKNCLWEARRGK